MERHGSESYYVLGEGLLAETAGGRVRTLSAAAEASTVPFRFTRMGPSGQGKQQTIALLKKLGEEMVGTVGGAAGIPAGYTYLGQFVDHDLTFDKTNVMLDENVTPAQLVQARSPSLDLDSLYGAGPNDPASEKFYEADKVHLKMGTTVAAGGVPAKPGFDLLRGAGSNAEQKRKAIIPDPRNDENLAVAQLHLAMIRFHNRVVDTLPSSVPPGQRFAKARQKVVKHYQWMLKTDYLPRICAPGVVNNVFNQGRKAFEVGADPMSVPTMPIEFSVAAFRLGHSMIRAAYNWNRDFDSGAGTLDWLFIFSAGSGDLGGNPRLASNWIADWRRLFDFSENSKPALVVPAEKFNRAMRLDTRLVDPLDLLPGFPPPDEGNLASRNLRRGRMVKLATGQQMFTFLKNKGVTLDKLTNTEIRDGNNNGIGFGSFTPAQRTALIQRTPLWFYILREAEFNNGRLKGVGARIVAETFQRAMEGSTHSIVRDAGFKPSLGPNNQTFRMVDLLWFAFEGKKALLNPLGD